MQIRLKRNHRMVHKMNKTILILLSLGLCSCGDMHIQGRVYGVDPHSGAKGGLTVRDSHVGLWAKSDNVTVEVEAEK